MTKSFITLGWCTSRPDGFWENFVLSRVQDENNLRLSVDPDQLHFDEILQK